MVAGGTKHDRTWGMLCHLIALCGYIGVPFGHILGPLIVWLVKKDESRFVNDQGKESLNFQISVTIYLLIAGILTVILIGFVLLVIVAVASVILVILASVSAYNGRAYRYPLTIRLIK